MPSITSWMRLEPHCRDGEMERGLQSRVSDPLWMLGRQWQMGEFQGEDNGSPIIAQYHGEKARLTRYHDGQLPPRGSVAGEKYDPSRLPLETLVEREPRYTGGDPHSSLRFAVDAGQQFLQFLALQPLSKSYDAQIRELFGFEGLSDEAAAELDPASVRYARLLMPRVPDGMKLHAAFILAMRPGEGAEPTLPAGLEVAPADVAEMEKAALQWLNWCDTFASEPATEQQNWQRERMEYRFAVAAGLSSGERVLEAAEYYEGRLDWSAFEVRSTVKLGASTDESARRFVQTVLPAPVSYKGMPATRFWEFEDAQVDFGAIDAGPEDLARMLFMEVAMTFGNDWFVIPLEMEIGTVCDPLALVVTDTFGVRTLISHSADAGAPHSDWRMYQIGTDARSRAQQARDGSLFMVPPSLVQPHESRPIEDVLFLRDEMANMAWAVERTIEGPIELPVGRREAEIARRAVADDAQSDAPEQDEAARYRLATRVPEYWVPLLPVREPAGKPAIQLQPGAVLTPDDEIRTVRARGRLLQGEGLRIPEEEIPREGIRVTRSWQLARWLDGSTHLWVGRRKRVGRGEGSSGLRFDAIEESSG